MRSLLVLGLLALSTTPDAAAAPAPAPATRPPAKRSRAAPPSAKRPLRARPPAPRPAAPRPRARRARPRLKVVLLLEKSDPKSAASVATAIRGQLADAGVRLELQTVERFAAELSRQLELARKAATARQASVVVWLSLTTAEPLYLYFVERQGVRLIMRNFGTMEPDERAEAAAIVVRTSVLAFLRGHRLGRKIKSALPRVRKRMLTKPDARPRFVAPVRRIWTSLELGYAYAYDDWDNHLTGQHGLALRVAVHITPRWRILVGYRLGLLAPLAEPTGRSEALLQLHRLEGGARFGHRLGPWTLGASLLLGADYVAYQLRGGSLVEKAEGAPLLLPNVAATFHVGYRLTARLRLQLDLGAEVGLYTPTLRLKSAADPSGFSKFGRPEVVRPRLLLALAVDLV